MTGKINNKLINQSEIARRLGVSQAYINMLLSGKRTNPAMMKKINRILKDHLKAA